MEVSPRSSDSGSGLKSSKQVSITNDRNEVDTSEKSDLQDRLSVVQNFAQISLSGHLNSSRVCEHSVRVFEKKILRRGWLARRSGRGISFWRKVTPHDRETHVAPVGDIIRSYKKRFCTEMVRFAWHLPNDLCWGIRRISNGHNFAEWVSNGRAFCLGVLSILCTRGEG